MGVKNENDNLLKWNLKIDQEQDLSKYYNFEQAILVICQEVSLFSRLRSSTSFLSFENRCDA